MKKDELKVGMKVRVNDSDMRKVIRGRTGTITSVVTKAGFVPGVVHAQLDGGDETAFWPSELEAIEAPKQHTLHGRPVKEGDVLWSTHFKEWVFVGNFYGMKQAGFNLYGSLDRVCRNEDNDFFWDKPPVVDPRTIPPPLYFCQGHPVRIGSIMYSKQHEVAVTVAGGEYFQFVEVILPKTGNRVRVDKGHLTYDFPNTPPAPKKVHQVRTRWYNIYENDAGRTSYSTYGTETEAKKYALPGCLGQGWFKYEFVGPEAKQQ